ncbi:hypothetical protein KTD31_01270 [Burkholderia multivorans]|uniref:hypothetical protein n=1 Tax=Burkholderia multivorans TaxID=87883 RepID=UPI001C22743D|nr:hypothetical protein [Burkholderia multivorans]MBU9200032.1 hypothetical protein [Burkholderia multivorans]MDN8078849.1 hypothetical protein [Burkholderia multivorans]
MSENKNMVIFDADSVVDMDAITRIDRSGVIEPGHHWQCRKDVTGVASNRESIEFEFREGLVYLLTRLVFFDGKLHSVELLNDPSVNTGLGILTLPLLLEHFEPLSEDAAVAFRQQQMAAIQGEAAEVQREMAEAQTNPALLEPVIREGLEKWERELARANRRDDAEDDEPAPKAQLPALGTNGQFSLSGAITHRITSTDIEVFRHMAQREGKIAEIRGQWLTEKVEYLGKVLKKLAPFYSEHAAIGQARAHEALGLSKEVEKGLRSLRLYTGDGVTVEQVAKGASAPADEPLTVYQRKLYMDEEFAVWDDVDRMFDYASTGVFFKALRENEGLRQQLIPAPRGVVGMAVRRQDVNYEAKSMEDMLANARRNEANKALFLLVRDGENWYQVYSDEPSHELSPRLFPTRNEMDSIFEGLDGEKIGFEDLRFTHRTTEYDRKALAYKRFLILACGLDHSRKLFGQFYPEREALSFISMEFQRKYMRFVRDDDSDVMLGDNVPSVHALIDENQGQLAAGCRVLVFCRQAISERDAAPGAYNNGTYSHNGGMHYTRMVRPVHKAIFATVRRDKDDLVVHVPVEREREYTSRGWGRYEPITRKHFSVKVALNKLQGGTISYLITDTLRAEELRPYIYSRIQRASHWDYIYGFKLAMQMLADEEAANAPVMAHLQSEAAVKFGLAPEAAAIAATSAAQGWRLKNPDASVLPAVDSPAYADLDFQLAEASYAFTRAIPAVEKHIAALGGRLVRVMRGKKGVLIAYYEQPKAEKDARIKPWRWMGRRTYTAAGKPTKDAPQSVWMIAGRITGEAELYSVPSEFTQPYREGKDSLLVKLTSRADKVDAMAAILTNAFKGEREGVSDEAWAHLTAENEAEKERHGRRGRPEFDRDKRVLLPVALDTKNGEIVGVAAKVYDLLYHYGSDAQRGALLEQGYTLPKPKKDYDRKVIPYEGPELSIYVDQYVYPSQYTGPVGTDVHISPFRDYVTGFYGYTGENRLDQSLNFIMAHGPEDARRSKDPHHWDHSKYLNGKLLWVPQALRNEDGTAAVSRLFPGVKTA